MELSKFLTTVSCHHSTKWTVSVVLVCSYTSFCNRYLSHKSFIPKFNPKLKQYHIWLEKNCFWKAIDLWYFILAHYMYHLTNNNRINYGFEKPNDEGRSTSRLLDGPEFSQQLCFPFKNNNLMDAIAITNCSFKEPLLLILGSPENSHCLQAWVLLQLLGIYSSVIIHD